MRRGLINHTSSQFGPYLAKWCQNVDQRLTPLPGYRLVQSEGVKADLRRLVQERRCEGRSAAFVKIRWTFTPSLKFVRKTELGVPPPPPPIEYVFTWVLVSCCFKLLFHSHIVYKAERFKYKTRPLYTYYIYVAVPACFGQTEQKIYVQTPKMTRDNKMTCVYSSPNEDSFGSVNVDSAHWTIRLLFMFDY